MKVLIVGADKTPILEYLDRPYLLIDDGDIIDAVSVDPNHSVTVFDVSIHSFDPLNLGTLGTINYATGAFSITFPVAPQAGAPIFASYQAENSNNGGITDFRFANPRLAGQGAIFSQEYLGEAIQNVVVFQGKYYSFKKTSIYQLDLGTNDTTATNIVYRKDIGIPSLRSSVSMGKGMAYMDTSNNSKPMLSMLVKNVVAEGFEAQNLTPQFAWENYDLSECVVDTWGENIVVMTKSQGARKNDMLFLVNVNQEYSVEITSYGGNTLAKNAGILYVGSSTVDSVFETFSGYDDLGSNINNFASSKKDNYGDDTLKKFRYLQLSGLIDPSQSYEVYATFDDGDTSLIGTIVGSKDYVRKTGGITIGATMLGDDAIGGEETTAYPYTTQLKVRTPKFRIRQLKFKAIGTGYVSIIWTNDFDIFTFEQKLPSAYRTQVYQSLDGATSGLANMP